MLIRKLKIRGMVSCSGGKGRHAMYIHTVDESFVQLKVCTVCTPYGVLRTILSTWFTSSGVTCYDFAERDRGRTPSPPAPCSIGLRKPQPSSLQVYRDLQNLSKEHRVTYGPDSARLYTNKTNITSYPSPQVTRKCRKKMFTKSHNSRSSIS